MAYSGYKQTVVAIQKDQGVNTTRGSVADLTAQIASLQAAIAAMGSLTGYSGLTGGPAALATANALVSALASSLNSDILIHINPTNVKTVSALKVALNDATAHIASSGVLTP